MATISEPHDPAKSDTGVKEFMEIVKKKIVEYMFWLRASQRPLDQDQA